jgi:aspartate aminotransferase
MTTSFDAAATAGPHDTHFALSQRGLRAEASPIRRLSPHAEAAKSRGVEVLHLNIGQPDIATPQVMLQAYQAFSGPVLAYGASEGALPYRQDLATYYNSLGADKAGTPIAAADILVTVGGSEALMFAVAATCDPGDEVLVCEPYYPNYKGYAHILAVGARAVTTTAEAGFHPTAADIAAAIGPRTRLVMLSSPGNPSGAVLSSAELHAIAEVCRDKGVFLVSDEVYRDFVYDPHVTEGGTTSPSLLSLQGFDELAIVIDSVSKRYSACGARVGCLVTRNRALYASVLKFAQTRLSPPVVDQLAARAALHTPPQELRAAIDEYRRRRDALVGALATIPGVSAQTPEGAFYLMVHLPVDDAERFCIWMLAEYPALAQAAGQPVETVMLAPGDGFYTDPALGRHQVRAAYVLEVPKLLRAAEILRRGLALYPGRLA